MQKHPPNCIGIDWILIVPIPGQRPEGSDRAVAKQGITKGNVAPRLAPWSSEPWNPAQLLHSLITSYVQYHIWHF